MFQPHDWMHFNKLCKLLAFYYSTKCSVVLDLVLVDIREAYKVCMCSMFCVQVYKFAQKPHIILSECTHASAHFATCSWIKCEVLSLKKRGGSLEIIQVQLLYTCMCQASFTVVDAVIAFVINVKEVARTHIYIYTYTYIQTLQPTIRLPSSRFTCHAMLSNQTIWKAVLIFQTRTLLLLICASY